VGHPKTLAQKLGENGLGLVTNFLTSLDILQALEVHHELFVSLFLAEILLKFDWLLRLPRPFGFGIIRAQINKSNMIL
jgi:hypothetical protein